MHCGPYPPLQGAGKDRGSMTPPRLRRHIPGDARMVRQDLTAWAAARRFTSESAHTATASRPASHDADQTPLAL